MYLKTLSLVNFKNLAHEELAFLPRVNVFLGNNGQGKTNILDAIHYLSFCKSYFNNTDTQNIRHGEPFFMIQGVFQQESYESEIHCAVKRGQKKVFKRNKKEYERLAEHIGLYPLVVISPADIDLINEGSETRRRFIDTIISQFDKQYLEYLIHYNKILVQRNALLKKTSTGTVSYDLIEVLNAQLVSFGERIFERRKNFIEEFNPYFEDFFSRMAGTNEKVKLSYNSDLFRDNFENLLQKNYERDRRLEYTSVGIHKDDLIYHLNDYPIKKFGSQGQQKTFLIALKLAQHFFIGKMKGFPPILLLDDIFDKLDNNRVNLLVELVTHENFGQVFITDTDPQKIPRIFEEKNIPYKKFTVENGTVNT